MDKIITSKKNLMDHWKKAIFEIQEKDKNLQKMKDALKIDEEMNIKITSEIAGIEKEIRDQKRAPSHARRRGRANEPHQSIVS